MTLPDCLPIPPLQVEASTGLPEFPSVGWRALRDLPPFAFVQIRAMGEMLFSPLTRTPLGRIEVLPLSDQSAPSAQHGQQLSARPLRVGEHLEITCEALPLLGGMPYRASALRFLLQQHTYLLVADFAGRYLYRWPSADNLTSDGATPGTGRIARDRQENSGAPLALEQIGNERS